MSANLAQRLLLKLIEPSKFFPLICRIFFLCIRYPCCSQDYIDQHINVPGVPMDELQLYSSYSDKAAHLMNWLMVVFVIYGAKNMIYIYFTLSQVNFSNPTLNIRDTDNSSYQFACLQTNCTKLTDVDGTQFSLADDLLQLPIFSICRQQLRWLFNPFIGSQTIGLLYMSEFTFMSVTLCSLYPVFVHATRITENKTIMFQLCPLASVNVLRRQIFDNLTTVTISEVNFYEAMSTLECYSATRHVNHCLALLRLKKLKQSQLDNRQLKDYIDDCLPINRTQWWRSNMTRTFALLVVLSIISWILILGLAPGLLISHSVTNDYRRASEQLEFANRTNCFLKLSQLDVDLDKEHIRLDWNYYSAIESMVAFILVVYIIAVTMINYFFFCKDEKLCILELEEQLKVAVNFSQILKSRKCPQTRFASSKRLESAGHFKLAPIRQRLIELIDNFDWALFILHPRDRINRRPIKTKLEEKISDQQFAVELIGSSPNLNAYCELLEKLHITFTQFTLFLEQNNQGITNVLLFTGLLNFGYTIIAVYFYRNFEGLVVEPIGLTVCSLLSMTFFIGIASDIHSSLKRLQPLVWTLIGENMNASDEKLQLLRILWLRQMISIERSGGLGNRFKGHLITYVGIIRMLLWTLTILTVLTR